MIRSMYQNKNNFILLLCFSTALCIVIFNINNSFFWDGVHYGSIQPDFYYATHFTNYFVPDSMDSGEVPSFAMYIAAAWTLFGRTLTVSHLAMLPFVFGIVLQLFLLCRKFINPEYAGIALILLLADTTLLSQFSLVSPDLPLLFFFLLGLNSLLKNRKLLLAICICFLFLNITRGVLLSFCLLLFDIYLTNSLAKNWKEKFNLLFKKSLIYIPGLILFFIYNYNHFILKGWMLSYEGSPWEGTKEVVDLHGFLVNTILLLWRLIDFGKIIIWIILLMLLLKLKKQFFILQESKSLLFLAICILLFVHIDMLWAKNLLAHRYFMPFNIILSLLCASILFSNLVSKKIKYIATFLWFSVLISGSFWIYPDKIAKGWDSTLAHIPYFELRHHAIQYLNEEKIDFKDVGTFFPNTASLDKIDLNHDVRNFNNYNVRSKYVFYSNIYNISDTAYDAIHDKDSYELLKRFDDNGVFIELFKKR